MTCPVYTQSLSAGVALVLQAATVLTWQRSRRWPKGDHFQESTAKIRALSQSRLHASIQVL